ncbi:MAG: mitochondrial fission ELM1 family protein, partial [Rhodospirillales bacterium]|nr:mitochondrial fission ELM1 family protein [Rhodospirillales bacterium]
MNMDGQDKDNFLIWVLADQALGTAEQCLGVAEALGHAYEVKKLGRSSISNLPNVFFGRGLLGLPAKDRRQIAPPWPNLVISGGRRTAPVARYIKHQAGGTCFLAHVMHPGWPGAGEFDLIAVPRHDRVEGKNIFPITGAPHRVGEDTLSRARQDWLGRIGGNASPIIGLLLGGPTRQKTFSHQNADGLGRKVGALTASLGGSLVISSSPRTGNILARVCAAAEKGGTKPALSHKWVPVGENPFMGILAIADILVVSGDSVSMICQAAATGKGVYIYAPPGFAVEKHVRFHEDLYAEGFARPLLDRLEIWPHPP